MAAHDDVSPGLFAFLSFVSFSVLRLIVDYPYYYSVLRWTLAPAQQRAEAHGLLFDRFDHVGARFLRLAWMPLAAGGSSSPQISPLARWRRCPDRPRRGQWEAAGGSARGQ